MPKIAKKSFMKLNVAWKYIIRIKIYVALLIQQGKQVTNNDQHIGSVNHQ